MRCRDYSNMQQSTKTIELEKRLDKDLLTWLLMWEKCMGSQQVTSPKKEPSILNHLPTDDYTVAYLSTS